MPNAEIVRRWFHERIANGPIARDTPAYNQALAAMDDLIARLDAASAPEPVPEPAPAPAEPAAEAPPQPEPAAEAASEKE